MKEEYIKSQFHTNASMLEVSKYAKCRQPYVKKVWTDAFGEDAVRLRKRSMYSESKKGDKNPMLNKTGALHHNYRKELSKSHGYVRLHRPSWYTGASSDGYVREHILVYCAAKGWTELPDGQEIHHLDEDKTNNVMSNLILLSSSDHIKLHSWMKKALRATTIPEGSRDDGNIPKRTTSEKSEDDIV